MIAKNLPAGWAALSVPLILIGGMAGKLACGFLAERFGIIRTIVVTEIATGAGILLTLVLPDLGAYLLLPLIGVALNGTSSVLYATIGDLVDKDRLPRAFGLFYTLGSTCGLIAPLAFGVIGDALGVATSIAADRPARVPNAAPMPDAETCAARDRRLGKLCYSYRCSDFLE